MQPVSHSQRWRHWLRVAETEPLCKLNDSRTKYNYVLLGLQWHCHCSILSKVFEHFILDRYDIYYDINVNQFDFKKVLVTEPESWPSGRCHPLLPSAERMVLRMALSEGDQCWRCLVAIR